MSGADWLQMVASDANGQIIGTEDIPCQDLDGLGTALQAFCEQHQISDPACTVVLPASDYQMLLVEAPPVDQEELAAALQWKIKDLLQTSVEDSVVDGFLLPEDAYRGRQKMAYAVATSRSDLQRLVDKINDSGAEVDRVEVPELVLLRMINDLGHDEHAEMVIVVGRQRGFLAVIADKAIYLSRSFDMGDQALGSGGADAFASNGPIDNFILEMQRSRDYFESQIGKGVVGRILLAPLNSDETALINAIADRLGASVEMMDVSAVASLPPELGGAEGVLLASASAA